MIKVITHNIKLFLSLYYVRLIGGFVFTAIFLYRYTAINPDYFTARDDGVITMSHARNLIDYGFIGVSPSGERVEGYSAPVQFFAYAAFYLLTGLSFLTFAKIQTIFCTFTLGAIYASFFEGKVFAVIASVITAFGLTWQTSFFEWHGSGMENAITHSMFALTVYFLFKFSRENKINICLATIPFLASISRLDGIYHILPLLAIFNVHWISNEKSFKSIQFSMVTLSLWLIYNIWRYFYFGDISPNTAYAQGISVSERISELIRLDKVFLQDATQLSRQIFSIHGGFYVLIVAPLLPYARFRNEWTLLFILCLSLLLTAWFNPVFFGATRLDVTRSTTQMAFFAFLAISSVIYLTPRSRILMFSPLLLPIFVVAHSINYVDPYELCCNYKSFDEVRRKFQLIADNESLPRPMVANPDLGVMSWYKQFNVLDLGMLGSTIFSRMKAGVLRADYFFDFAAPDIIEMHAWWKCGENTLIFSDPRFTKSYRLIELNPHDLVQCQSFTIPGGIWIRRDIEKTSRNPERELIDDLKGGFSLDRISQELDGCHENEYKNNCSYISRTVYRFIPEIKSNGQLKSVIDLFKEKSGNTFDMFLLAGSYDVTQTSSVIRFIFKRHLMNNHFKPIGKENGFDLYVSDKELAVYSESCGGENKMAPFYLHAIPISEAEINSTKYGFINLDFSIKSDGVYGSGVCGAIRKLPDVKIRNIVLGQWIPATEKEIWEFNIDFSSQIP